MKLSSFAESSVKPLHFKTCDISLVFRCSSSSPYCFAPPLNTTVCWSKNNIERKKPVEWNYIMIWIFIFHLSQTRTLRERQFWIAWRQKYYWISIYLFFNKFYQLYSDTYQCTIIYGPPLTIPFPCSCKALLWHKML